MKHKILVLILSLFLLLPLICGTEAHAAATSGSCGDNLVWEFDADTQTLVISGQGEMKFDYAPWSDLKRDIKTVVLKDGVTSTARYAFANLEQITNIVFPESLTTIGAYSFSGCYALEEVSIPHVTFMDCYAFYGSGLTKIIIPAGVTKISSSSFEDCKKLEKIVFHDKITEIGFAAFRGCTNLKEVSIPNSVTLIDDVAFDFCTKLEKVYLGTGLTELGGNAFECCYSLTSIKIPDGVSRIGLGTFRNCTMLQDVFIGAGVTEIDSEAFAKCSSLTAFKLSKNNRSLYVDKGVLYSADRSELLMIPCGFSGAYTVLPETKHIRYAAAREGKIRMLVIPGNVRTIGKSAFSGCEQLRYLVLSEGLETIEEFAFWHIGTYRLGIPSTVKKIDRMAFSGCSATIITFMGPPPEDEKCYYNFNDILGYVNAKVFYSPKYEKEWKEAQWSYDYGELTWQSYNPNIIPKLKQLDGQWVYHYNNVPFAKTTLIQFNGGWYYVRNGIVDKDYTGLYQYRGSWYYLKNGKIDWGYTGLCKHNGNWYYVKSGKLDWGYTGLSNHNGGWYYVKSGKLNWGYTGLCNYNGGWYFIKSGKLDWGYTGLCKHNGNWYYVKSGKLDWSYTGLCKYSGAWYYVRSGKLDWSYSGVVSYKGKSYTVRKGVVR